MKKLNIIALIIALVGFILIITGIVIQKAAENYCNNMPFSEINFEKCEKYFKNKWRIGVVRWLEK